jgi:DNA-binding LacI/PurR family transcriptional regulator
MAGSRNGLLERLGGARRERRRTLLPTRLVVRASTARA